MRVHREYLGYMVNRWSPQYKPYRLVLCKDHWKEFKKLIKEDYIKGREKIGLDPIELYFKKFEKTDEPCMMCKYPEKFKRIDIFEWMDVERVL